MDGISATSSGQVGAVDSDFGQEDTAVCNEHADTIVQSLQIRKDGLIDEIGAIQSRIDQLSLKLEEIDAKHDPIEEGIKGAISPNAFSSAVGAIVGFAGSLAQESVEMAPVEQAMRKELKTMEDTLSNLDYVNSEIMKQINNCD